MLKMKDMVVGMKLEDGRTNELFTVVEKNSKYKTVILEVEDGTTRSTSIATIGKHFEEVVMLDDLGTPVEEETVEMNIIEQEENVSRETLKETENVAVWTSKCKLTWKDMLDVYIEKQKTEKKERKKREKVAIWDIIYPLLDNKEDVIVTRFQKGCSVKIEGKKLFELWERCTKVRMYIKTDRLELLDNIIDLVENVVPKPGDNKYTSLYIPANHIEIVLNTVLA